MKIVRYECEGAQVWRRNSKHSHNYSALMKRLKGNEGENRYRCGENEHIIIKARAASQEDWKNKKVVHNIYIERYGKERREDGLFLKKLKRMAEKFSDHEDGEDMATTKVCVKSF